MCSAILGLVITNTTRFKDPSQFSCITAIGAVASAIFAALTIAPPALAASEIRDPQGDWVTGTNPDFDIRKAAVNEDRNPFIEVYGTAGGTMASGTGIV